MKRAISLRKRVFYPHPVGAVWKAITDPAALAEWLMPNTFVPEVGRRFQFMTDPVKYCPDARTECEVLELDPPRRMVWSWQMIPRDGSAPGEPMTVTWTLTEARGGTTLELLHEGMEQISWGVRMAMRMGWWYMVKRRLPRVLTGVRGQGGEYGFTSVIPLEKRHYKEKTVPREYVR